MNSKGANIHLIHHSYILWHFPNKNSLVRNSCVTTHCVLDSSLIIFEPYYYLTKKRNMQMLYKAKELTTFDDEHGEFISW